MHGKMKTTSKIFSQRPGYRENKNIEIYLKEIGFK
jgi:hypothetical protein